MKRVAYLGGSFDPVHLGHLNIARELQASMNFDALYLLPCFLSPLKNSSGASAEQRIEMLRRSLKEYPELALDLREVQKERVSYTIDTLRELRKDCGKDAGLYFILGWDSWQSLDLWRDWRKLFDYCNFIVVARPGFKGIASNHVQDELQGRELSANEIIDTTNGKFCVVETQLWDMSSSQIRSMIAAGESSSQLLSEPVNAYIRAQKLYQQK